ncbi:MAG: WbqC family protein [Xanthomonadales bacterium]|nr:WbqC family protein [Xanthomonadales bacterium]
MKLAVMQPYFFPYIGYFQLIAAADLFIVYDNIKYTKKGWINRNRMLQNGKDVIFTLPLKQDSDHLDVREREVAVNFNRDKFLAQIGGAYRKAPYYSQTMPLVEEIVRNGESNLFRMLHYSILRVAGHLGIETPIRISSEVPIDHSLRNQDKVLAFCEAVGAKTYLNAIGGLELYSREIFAEKGITLQFIKQKPFEYPQFDKTFVPWLSIIDVMMFNPIDAIRKCVSTNYELI